MKCTKCESCIEEERLELLPHTLICSSCSKKVVDNDGIRGAMIVDQDGTTHLQVMGERQYELHKQTIESVTQAHL
jgi:RNA polymerase-binding transcription factor DksA